MKLRIGIVWRESVAIGPKTATGSGFVVFAARPQARAGSSSPPPTQVPLVGAGFGHARTKTVPSTPARPPRLRAHPPKRRFDLRKRSRLSSPLPYATV